MPRTPDLLEGFFFILVMITSIFFLSFVRCIAKGVLPHRNKGLSFLSPRKEKDGERIDDYYYYDHGPPLTTDPFVTSEYTSYRNGSVPDKYAFPEVVQVSAEHTLRHRTARAEHPFEDGPPTPPTSAPLTSSGFIPTNTPNNSPPPPRPFPITDPRRRAIRNAARQHHNQAYPSSLPGRSGSTSSKYGLGGSSGPQQYSPSFSSSTGTAYSRSDAQFNIPTSMAVNAQTGVWQPGGLRRNLRGTKGDASGRQQPGLEGFQGGTRPRRVSLKMKTHVPPIREASFYTPVKESSFFKKKDTPAEKHVRFEEAAVEQPDWPPVEMAPEKRTSPEPHVSVQEETPRLGNSASFQSFASTSPIKPAPVPEADDHAWWKPAHFERTSSQSAPVKSSTVSENTGLFGNLALSPTERARDVDNAGIFSTAGLGKVDGLLFSKRSNQATSFFGKAKPSPAQTPEIIVTDASAEHIPVETSSVDALTNPTAIPPLSPQPPQHHSTNNFAAPGGLFSQAQASGSWWQGRRARSPGLRPVEKWVKRPSQSTSEGGSPRLGRRVV